jgi:hypothetical protein
VGLRCLLYWLWELLWSGRPSVEFLYLLPVLNCKLSCFMNIFFFLFYGLWISFTNYSRPGFGGSTPVPIQQRIKVWLETVPCLLKQLKATHVALIAASAGTIFLMNTLYYLPHILPPKSPYAAFLAPWVHPNHSHVTAMTIASYIPNKLIANYWNRVSYFIAMTLRPAFQSSSGVLSSAPVTAKSAPNTGEDTRHFEALGMTTKQRDATLEAMVNFVFAEDTTGANDEAMLCLKKGKGVMWDICDDYEAFVPKLSLKWKQEFPESKLKIQAYFAEDDIMIGTRGAEYFKKCWNEEACSEAILFEGIQTSGTTHDSIGDPVHAILEEVLRQAKRSLEGVAVLGPSL